MHTFLILGGYGFFGRRIARALASDPGTRVLIGGRDRARAQAESDALGLPPEDGIAIDTQSADFAQRVADLRIDTLIHVAGPFQGQDYRVAEAAIAAGAHYIDLADGRAFVAGIVALDAAARARDVLVVSGASSVPALSSAVVDRYLPRFSRLDTIQHGIGSGGRAPGLATMRGVLGYCGKPISRLEQGRWRATYGWMDTARHRFPDPVGIRWLGSCDVPDLELFPQRYPDVKTVAFHAGFASRVGHFAVWAGAVLVRIGVLRNLSAVVPAMRRVSGWLEPFASDAGGMYVEMTGIDREGKPLQLTWHLVATHNDGPHIPCGAAIALARKLARGESVSDGAMPGGSLPRGAMPCMGLVSVDEYLGALAGLHVREVPP